jgi:hypothetical protein
MMRCGAFLYNRWLKVRYKDPLILTGMLLVTAGVTAANNTLGVVLSFFIDFKKYDIPVLSFALQQESTTCFGVIMIIFGIVLLVCRSEKLSLKFSTIMIYLRGYDNMEEHAPVDAVPAKYRMGMLLKWKYDITKSEYDVLHRSPQDALKCIQYRIPEDIARMVDSNGATNASVIFAGRAFVPLQYAAGRVLGTRAGFTLMDFDRERGEWHLLDRFDDGERVKLVEPAKPGERREAALVLPFTVRVSDEQIPEGLRDVIYRFELDKYGPRQDSMASQEKMNAILSTVNSFIRNLRAEVDVLHVFAAVSTSTAVKMGCLFQNNAYPETLVYQFDTRAGGYTWALRLLADEMEIALE